MYTALSMGLYAVRASIAKWKLREYVKISERNHSFVRNQQNAATIITVNRGSSGNSSCISSISFNNQHWYHWVQRTHKCEKMKGGREWEREKPPCVSLLGLSYLFNVRFFAPCRFYFTYCVHYIHADNKLHLLYIVRVCVCVYVCPLFTLHNYFIFLRFVQYSWCLVALRLYHSIFQLFLLFFFHLLHAAVDVCVVLPWHLNHRE